jgi:hypothetical protein
MWGGARPGGVAGEEAEAGGGARRRSTGWLRHSDAGQAAFGAVRASKAAAALVHGDAAPACGGLGGSDSDRHRSPPPAPPRGAKEEQLLPCRVAYKRSSSIPGGSLERAGGVVRCGRIFIPER